MRVLSLLAALLFSYSAYSVDNEPKPGTDAYLRSCPMILKGVDFQTFSKAIAAQEVTANSLKNAEKLFFEYFKQLVMRSPIVDQLAPQFQSIIQGYSSAVSARVRGMDLESAQIQSNLETVLQVDFQQVQSAVVAAAEDQRIYRPFSVAEFIMARQPSIEALLLHFAYNDPQLAELSFSTLEQNGKFVSMPMISGVRQMEMVRTVLQYSTTRPNDKILEIGYHTPAVALGLAHYARVKVTGVDLIIPPDGANEILNTRGVNLINGHFPDTVNDQLKKIGPFKVIAALDVIKKDMSVLDTKTSPQNFVKAMFELLEEGGHVVLINDFNGEPYFSKEQAQAAGFTVVRWGFRQYLSEDIKKLMPYHPEDPNAGVLATYVLRKGEIKKGETRLQSSAK